MKKTISTYLSHLMTGSRMSMLACLFTLSLSQAWAGNYENFENTYMTYCIILLAVIAHAIFILVFISRQRIHKAIAQKEEQAKIIMMSLEMGKYIVTGYDVHSKRLKNHYGSQVPDEGLSREEVLSRVHPDDKEAFMSAFRNVITAQSEIEDVTHRWNKGTAEEPVWVDYRGKTLALYKNGKPYYTLEAFKDVTEEMKEVKVIDEAKKRYKKVFDQNIIAMSIYDDKGNLVDVNDRMKEMMYYSETAKDYFMNNNLFKLSSLKGDISFKHTDTVHVCQHMYMPTLHIDKYLDIRIKRISDELNSTSYHVVAVRDITQDRNMYKEQKRRDQKLIRANENITKRAQQLRYLMDQSNMFVWQYDANTDLVNFPRTSSCKGYTMKIQELDNLPEDEPFRQNWIDVRDAILSKEKVNKIVHYDRTPADEHPCWCAITGSPIFDAKGNFKAYYGIIRNINSLMEAQIKLKEETERAENSGRMKSAFLANMTHEIRTPLNAVLGFSELLLIEDNENERKEYIQIIHDNCEMLLRLLNDFIEASTLREKTQELGRKEVDLAKWFNEFCEQYELRLQDTNVRFIKENPYESHLVNMNLARLKQILTSFITNAMKFTDHGFIKVGYRDEGNSYFFYCQDTGIGIPKEKQSVIFERFVQLDDFTQGTGLGLSISKEICEQYGAQIGVISDGEVGKGSTFWVRTPKKIQVK